MSRLLRPGGRGGGDVRLRLWFWMIFEGHARAESAREPRLSAGRRDWAVRLHLVEPRLLHHDGRREVAARRIDTAIARLAHENLVVKADRSSLRVLCDDGTGRPYEYENADQLRTRLARRAELLQFAPYGQRSLRYDAVERTSRGRDGAPAGRVVSDYWETEPIQLPLTLWANGWVSALSAAALVSLVLLVDQAKDQHGIRHPIDVPRIRVSQYAVSKDIWAKGCEELASTGLIRREPHRTAGAVALSRYFLHPDVMATSVACPYPQL